MYYSIVMKIGEGSSMNAGYSVNFYDRVGEDKQHNTYNY